MKQIFALILAFMILSLSVNAQKVFKWVGLNGDTAYIFISTNLSPSDSIDITPVPDPVGFSVGVNTFPWVPLSLYSDIGMRWVRCYFSSAWGWQPGGLAMEPMHQGETQETHGMDEYLKRADDLGVEVLLCIHQTPEWFTPTGRQDGANDHAPCKPCDQRSNPESYRDYSAMLFQVAARYGRVKHPDAVLRVDKTPRWNNDILNEKKSGLNLLTFLEVWNEEKWWNKGGPNSAAYIEPETMAAMMSAAYDGHCGTMGPGVGIKTADPSMRVVMPGLTDFDLNYCKKMDQWFWDNRMDKSWPCDVISFHHYSNTGNKKGQYPAQWNSSGACTPSGDANIVSVLDVIEFAEGLGKKVWVTEFGADTKEPSGVFAKPRLGMSAEDLQSKIIIETAEFYKAAGVERVFIFTGPDEPGSADGGQFESSGLFTNQSTGYKPKKSALDLKAYLQNPNALHSTKATPANSYKFKRPLKWK